ncbi:hypothetical protein Y032_0296g1683 [Ancylostoma ceylanicum]|nr:hypothetical protein Y032_0296g1683 [Ancylostoma ceylanicum]
MKDVITARDILHLLETGPRNIQESRGIWHKSGWNKNDSSPFEVLFEDSKFLWVVSLRLECLEDLLIHER